MIGLLTWRRWPWLKDEKRRMKKIELLRWNFLNRIKMEMRMIEDEADIVI